MPTVEAFVASVVFSVPCVVIAAILYADYERRGKLAPTWSTPEIMLSECIAEVSKKTNTPAQKTDALVVECQRASQVQLDNDRLWLVMAWIDIVLLVFAVLSIALFFAV